MLSSVSIPQAELAVSDRALSWLTCPPHLSRVYKAMAIRPAIAAARPTSSLPAAPVDSARAPVDVPVAEPAAEPLGLGDAPVAVARVELEEESLAEPVPEAEAEAPVPLGLTLPVEVGTSVAVLALAHI